jgi:hypothetical protein
MVSFLKHIFQSRFVIWSILYVQILESDISSILVSDSFTSFSNSRFWGSWKSSRRSFQISSIHSFRSQLFEAIRLSEWKTSMLISLRYALLNQRSRRIGQVIAHSDSDSLHCYVWSRDDHPQWEGKGFEGRIRSFNFLRHFRKRKFECSIGSSSQISSRTYFSLLIHNSEY